MDNGPVTPPDHHQTELHDVGDAWLTFFAIFVVATIAMTTVLWVHVSFFWAVIGAVPIAIVGGWVSSLLRPVRKVVSSIMQWVFDCIALLL